MSLPQDENQPAPELTPESRAVLARARRSFLVSMGLLVLGLMVVVGAVVYRTSGSDSKGSVPYQIGALKIPSGGEVISAVAADNLVTLTYRIGSTVSIRVFDGKTGDVVREIPVVAE
jgi:hypothetical protein